MTHINLIAIAASEARQAAQNEETLEGRLRAAMRATRSHWLVTDEDSRFLAAVAGVLDLSDEATKERLGKELRVLRGLSAGSVADLEFLAEGGYVPVGLLGLWREIVEEGRTGCPAL